MGIDSHVELAVAALDLKLVQLLRQVMRAADTRGAGNGLPFAPAPAAEPRPHIHPEPRFDPRPVIHPTPRFEPRPVIHPQARVEQRRFTPPCDQPPQDVLVRKEPGEMPLRPPWMSMPWENSTQPAPAPNVKVARPHPDIIHKGLLLDFFI